MQRLYQLKWCQAETAVIGESILFTECGEPGADERPAHSE